MLTFPLLLEVLRLFRRYELIFFCLFLIFRSSSNNIQALKRVMKGEYICFMFNINVLELTGIEKRNLDRESHVKYKKKVEKQSFLIPLYQM